MTNKSDFGGQQTNFRPMIGPKQSKLQKVFKSLAGVDGAATAYELRLTRIQNGF